MLDWYETMSPGDQEFIRQFILESGSLKRMSRVYGVSYPTVRSRIDKIIEKISIKAESPEIDPFVDSIISMAIDDKITKDSADIIIDLYKEREKND